jgi:hypothetical protein
MCIMRTPFVVPFHLLDVQVHPDMGKECTIDAILAVPASTLIPFTF